MSIVRDALQTRKIEKPSHRSPESDRRRAQQILETLRSEVPVNANGFSAIAIKHESNDPFRVLVVTILSQSCTDTAALRAYRMLDRRIGATAHCLSRASVQNIAGAIRIGGLQKQKSKAIKRLARIVDGQPSGSLERIIRLPTKEAQGTLQ